MKSKTKRSSKGKVSIPLYRWMMFWLLVLCNVALIAALFGRVDVRTLLPKTEVKVVERIVEVEKEPSEADREMDSAAECATPADTPIDTYVTYVNKETGVSMSLPYSFGWRGQGCSIAPVDIYYDASFLGFGPGHIYGRYASLEIHSRDAAAEIIRVEVDSAPTSTDQLGAVSNIRRRTINGLNVTSYTKALDIGGSEDVWVAAGRTYTYIIRGRGEWLTDAEAVKIIQSLRVTK